MFVKKWLTSKVFIRRADVGYWEVILGSRIKSNLPEKCYGIVLDRFVNQPDARDARNEYHQLLEWRNNLIERLLSNATRRAAAAQTFNKQNLVDKWRSTKVLIQRQRNTTIIGPTYKIKLANDFVSPKKWITLKTDLITSSTEALLLAKQYSNDIKERNSITLDVICVPSDIKEFTLKEEELDSEVSDEDIYAYNQMW